MHCRLFSKTIFLCNTAKVNVILVWLSILVITLGKIAQLHAVFQMSRTYQNLYAVLLPFHTKNLSLLKGKKVALFFSCRIFALCGQ